MQFRVTGHDRATGRPVDFVFVAADVHAACAAAATGGIDVVSVNPLQPPAPPKPPPAAPQRGSAQTPTLLGRQPDAASVAPRWLLVALLFLIPCIGLFLPAVPTWAGIVLLALLALFIVPMFRAPLRPMFRIYPARPVWGAVRFGALLAYGGVLIAVGIGGRAAQADRWARAAKVRSDQAAREHTLQAAQAARERAIAEADQRAESLYSEAIASLDKQDTAAAVRHLNEAQGISNSQRRQRAAALVGTIQSARDPIRTREKLLELTDQDFDAFASGTSTPDSLTFPYKVLTDQAAERARIELPAARAERTERAKRAAEEARQEAEEARREAEEAKREAEEEERLWQQAMAKAEAKAEAERKAQAQRIEKERARRVAAEKNVIKTCNSYVALLAGVEVVDRVTATHGDGVWYATITVKNVWHVRHKQVRLQDAQSLWEAWAALASPTAPDRARIRIVDQRGNEVGGSRVLGGSLIWVQD